MLEREIVEVKVTQKHIDKALVGRNAGSCRSCAIHNAITDQLRKSSLISYGSIMFSNDNFVDSTFNYNCSKGLATWQQQLYGYQERSCRNRPRKQGQILMPKPIIIIFDRKQMFCYIKGEQ